MVGSQDMARLVGDNIANYLYSILSTVVDPEGGTGVFLHIVRGAFVQSLV